MQLPDSDEVVPVTEPVNDDQSKPLDAVSAGENNADDQSILDVSGKNLEFSVLENCESAVEGLYLYKNVFNLIPQRLGELRRLKTLKFFANEINLFPPEFRNLVGLECLQVKLSSPGLNGLPLYKLRGLKELELCKVPPRPSAFPLLSEIAGLKCLTKLSVCHFSIRYLPPEIGCLNNLEDLDLSFNKMKSLPTEISYLSALISLKVANNKLVELPSGLSSLQRLENLDLSNNRLTSLGSLELGSMHNLQNLNLQVTVCTLPKNKNASGLQPSFNIHSELYNKLLSCCQIPSWICCNLEGNGKDACNDEFISSSVEMDVLETTNQEIDESICYNGSPNNSSSTLTGPLSNSRCFVARMSQKGLKRRYYLQQRARQERLNNSRKWKSEDHAEVLAIKAVENCEHGKLAVLHPESLAEHAPDIVVLDNDDKRLLSEEAESENLLNSVEDAESSLRKGSCAVLDSIAINKGSKSECSDDGASLSSSSKGSSEKNEGSSSEVSKSTPKSKRHSDRDLDNPKPCKARRPVNEHSNLSCKYSKISFCNIEDHLPDGFYDAGRDRPFMPLTVYEQNFHFDSREVILLDRERDEGLDAITLSAQALVSHLKQLNGLTKERKQVTGDNLQIASLLALFVSDHFGGSDKSALIERTRKSVSGSNYQKPFVCSCSTGNRNNISTSNKQNLDTAEDIVVADLCEKSLRSIKARRNSIIVPIGTLQFGVCRHRALLMKYLCDRMEPPVPCELVRGYLDFLPHAWNIVCIKSGDSWVRMIVDACRPHDIREETDPEYFCRYIPLSRINVPLSTQSTPVTRGSFPSLSTCDEIANAPSSSLIQCKFGSVEAAAKVRILEVHGDSVDEVRNFEYCCLGEVRILGALKHSCIVEIYGHQISSKWIPASDGNLEHRVLQSAILMELVKGGSLKSYLEKLSEGGEKHVPVELAMCIARDVASALAELHSKHVIHRDIKSENILIDLDKKRADGTPVVKLCDFDRAVPLRSFLHSCCIAHIGIPPPDVCVGTPRWMAPEVLRAMHKQEIYGLEVDIWSYGCLLLELLTLQVPYSELSESQFHDQLQMGKRPQLPEELEALGSQEPEMARCGKEEGLETEVGKLGFLVDLFCWCTEGNPTDRPTAENLYKMLLTQTRSFASSRS